VTETALLRLSLRADERLLEAAFHDDIEGSSSSVSRRAESKMSSESMAQWESLPLNTAEDLQRWARAISQPLERTMTSTRAHGRHNAMGESAIQPRSSSVSTQSKSPDHIGEEVLRSSDTAQLPPQEPGAPRAQAMTPSRPDRDQDSLAITPEFRRQYLW
jgi:hypothetical protein